MADDIPEESDVERGARIRNELAREQLLGYATTPAIVPDEQAKPASPPDAPPQEG